MSARKQKLIKLGNAHGFRIRGSQQKYETLKAAVADADNSEEDVYIVVDGKSKHGVVRKINKKENNNVKS
jgi:biopolymer transport protein ExbD